MSKEIDTKQSKSGHLRVRKKNTGEGQRTTKERTTERKYGFRTIRERYQMIRARRRKSERGHRNEREIPINRIGDT